MVSGIVVLLLKPKAGYVRERLSTMSFKRKARWVCFHCRKLRVEEARI